MVVAVGGDAHMDTAEQRIALRLQLSDPGFRNGPRESNRLERPPATPQGVPFHAHFEQLRLARSQVFPSPPGDQNRAGTRIEQVLVGIRVRLRRKVVPFADISDLDAQGSVADVAPRHRLIRPTRRGFADLKQRQPVNRIIAQHAQPDAGRNVRNCQKAPISQKCVHPDRESLVAHQRGGAGYRPQQPPVVGEGNCSVRPWRGVLSGGSREGGAQRLRVRLQRLASGQSQISLVGLPYCLAVS